MSVKAPRESDVVKSCLQLLRLRGFMAFRLNTGAAVYQPPGGKRRFVRYSEPGAPDVLALKAGRLVCVECKSAKGRLRPAQAAWLDDARAHGAIALVIRSVDDLIAALAVEGL